MGSLAHAGPGVAQQARFEPWLEVLREAFAKGETPEEVADATVGGSDVRGAAFQLQALGRLYSSEDKEFKDIRKVFRTLENAVGDYDKWNNVLNSATNLSPAKLKELKAKREAARKELAKVLKDDEWVREDGKKTRLAKLESFLKDYDWRSYEKDKAVVLSKLEEQLQKVEDTEFDLSMLENGNGLHELRRELRWFAIEARVLNGLVIFAPDSDGCPVEDLADLVNQPIATSKYSGLPHAETETDPCRISHCLYLSVAQAVEDLGALKDQSEVENNASGNGDSDDVSQEIQADAEGILLALKENRVLGLLRSELRSCH